MATERVCVVAREGPNSPVESRSGQAERQEHRGARAPTSAAARRLLSFTASSIHLGNVGQGLVAHQPQRKARRADVKMTIHRNFNELILCISVRDKSTSC